MSVSLVVMPWHDLSLPSLPVGLLRAVATGAGLPRPDTYHANLRWAEFLLDRTGGKLGPAQYSDIAENGVFDSIGEWVFAGVLNDDPLFGVELLREYATDRDLDIVDAERMREHAADFIELAVAEILRPEPAVVGFTTTFMQNVPSLAAARRIKQLAPDTIIVFGGGNCDGDMGVALHRAHPFVDLVVRGEGEEAFPALLRALAGDGPLDRVPGLCWRDATGAQHVNDAGRPVAMAGVPVPDFDDWFEVMASSPVAEFVDPQVVLETSRGCWWGEKHHCTFCGLNGSLMQFRAKEPDHVLAELTELVTRHQVLDVVTVDNIIDMRYFTRLLPRIAELDWDLRLHYEIKANLRASEVDALRSARVWYVQPGIESLVTPVLSIMDKGVSAVQNVRLLREGESAGLSLVWNWLYGFPGETYDQYAPVLHQVPALVHLQPPRGVTRIALERFSPYFVNPALGFPVRRPARMYGYIYDLPDADLADLAYLFDTEPVGLTDAEAEPLRARLDTWAAGYGESALVWRDTGDAVVIEDTRAGWPHAVHRIDDPGLRQAYLALETGRSVPGLRRALADQGLSFEEDDLREWLAGLADRGLAFTDNGQWLTLATRSVPVKVAE
jgi:ribosomal peptide maturation radical SAM protein 1